MKKLILLSFLGLFFLAGCGNITNQIDPIVKQPPTPDTKITIWTGLILAEFWTQVKNELSRSATDEEKENGRKESIVSWYLYTYNFEDLWIQITTPALYDPYFFEQTEKTIIKRKDTMIYNPNQEYDYLAVFSKDPNISLEEEIISKHLSKWCAIQTGILTKESWFFSSMKWFYIVYITSADWNLASNWEIFDKEFPDNPLSISFVMDPNKPEKYYKFSYGDCAPGPCSIFGNIEFLD